MKTKYTNPTDAPITELLKLPPCEWESTVDELLVSTKDELAGRIARAMEDDAGRLAFLATYIACRSGSGTGGAKWAHAQSVKAANVTCRRVNKAMGYTYADRRVFNI